MKILFVVIVAVALALGLWAIPSLRKATHVTAMRDVQSVEQEHGIAGPDHLRSRVDGGASAAQSNTSTLVRPIAEDIPFVYAEAQQATRKFAVPLPSAYRRDFYANAVEWPDGVKLDKFACPSAACRIVNPDGGTFTKLQTEELREIVEQYDSDLRAMADLAFDLASESMEHYFDSGVGAGWVHNEVHSAATEISPTGLWSRNLIVRHGDYVRRIAFDSAGYIALESQLSEVAALRTERWNAVLLHVEKM